MTATPNPMERVAALEKQVMALTKLHKDHAASSKKQGLDLAAARKELAALKDQHRMLKNSHDELSKQVTNLK